MKKTSRIISVACVVFASLAFSQFPTSGFSKLMDQERAKEAQTGNSIGMRCIAVNLPPASSYSKLSDQLKARETARTTWELIPLASAPLPASAYSKLNNQMQAEKTVNEFAPITAVAQSRCELRYR